MSSPERVVPWDLEYLRERVSSKQPSGIASVIAVEGRGAHEWGFHNWVSFEHRAERLVLSAEFLKCETLHGHPRHLHGGRGSNRPLAAAGWFFRKL